MASGLLVVLLGEGTKLTPWVQGRDKRYVATVSFGEATDTLDAQGTVTASAPVPAGLLESRLAEVARSFVGHMPQTPPVYSALKSGGRSHMSRARAGETVIVPPRPATCHSLELKHIAGHEATIEVHVASGYYVRSLARDLGEALGLPSHLSALRRTSVGSWKVSEACPVDGVAEDALVPLVEALPSIPVVSVGPAKALALCQGKRVEVECDAPLVMVLSPAGVPVAMVAPDEDGLWRVKRGFAFEHIEGERHSDSLIDKAPFDG